MDSITKRTIKSHILDYLKIINPDFKQNKKGLFECPLKHEHEEDDGNPSCNIFPPNSHKLHCFNPKHGKIGDIFDLVKRIDPDMVHLKEDDIGEYLTHLLNIKFDRDVDKILELYKNSGFGLIALQKQNQGKASKSPVSGISWKKNISYNINQWKEWLNSGLGLALALGSVSKVMALDIDDEKTFEKMKSMLPKTATQTTKRGFHFLFAYDEAFEFLQHANLRSKGYEMELRNNNAYIVVAPTSVEGEKRFWNDEKIATMSPELKKFFLDLIEKPKENPQEKIQNSINKEELGLKGGLTGLDGQCSDMFTILGGILRKKMSPEAVKWSLYNFNKLLADPMDNKAIMAMCYQLEKYTTYDKKDLAEKVYNRLKMLEISTARELKESLKQEKNDIEEVLDYLIKEGKVVKYGRNYRAIQKVDWQTDFMSVDKPLNVKVPFFQEYNNFSDGSMIVLGAGTGKGKSHLACNVLYEFVNQEISPYYICTEAGSKFGTISASLGLKEGDFQFKIVKDPTIVELEDNAVTIIDWLKPKDSDYSKTDTIYEKLNEQLIKHRGLLIIFAQLRKDGRFFAEDLIDFYASFVAKYFHTETKRPDGSKVIDNINTYWKVEKMRDSKIGTQHIKIPTRFDKDTKRILLRGDK
jgi:hypothetical protein